MTEKNSASAKAYLPEAEGHATPPSQIGATLEALAATIAARRGAGEESYTARLLAADVGLVLGKVAEEAGEVVEAAYEAAALAVGGDTANTAVGGMSDTPGGDAPGLVAEVDHLRYEAADLVYHLLVVLERFGIPLDELAAELNMRMTDGERPSGGLLLFEEHIQRGQRG
ncbi:MAG: phosphoribosyl-ATP diphosphatase [Eggerthellaceae bacterium]|jgi:phosphoribosyl-ATP pyrophosphohydrolase/phosphoribosyl-ATP pyrophosphohydrolase/phosphoribosyl-AMP cyclohydrolase|nr:phosphoribosyl-ATP diphosphatase [Eggerthellaceae bacterium]MDR2716118.1 hypothetical protein [Coriobacteriaceae bacterium]